MTVVSSPRCSCGSKTPVPIHRTVLASLPISPHTTTRRTAPRRTAKRKIKEEKMLNNKANRRAPYQTNTVLTEGISLDICYSKPARTGDPHIHTWWDPHIATVFISTICKICSKISASQVDTCFFFFLPSSRSPPSPLCTCTTHKIRYRKSCNTFLTNRYFYIYIYYVYIHGEPPSRR